MMSFLKNTDKWKVGNEILMYIMQFLLVFFIVSFACTRLDIMGVGAVLTAFINISIYMRIKQKYEVFFESLGNFKNIYNFARWIVKDDTLGDIFVDDKTKASVEKLKRMTNAIVSFNTRKQGTMSGESYYFREARYLKRMIDVIDSRNNVLCVVDEILKGTNTHERIAASKAILDYIAKDNCIALIATHDMELTETDLYNKFYFDSTVLNDDIVFDYKIHEGIGGKSNAIALLEILGYPKTIVERARCGAERKV